MVKEGHRSHISSKEAKARGRGRIPSAEMRAETYNLAKEVGVDFMGGQYMTLTVSGVGADTTTGTFYDGNSTVSLYPYQTWVQLWNGDYYEGSEYTYGNIPNTITEIIKEKVVTKEVEQRTLYKVYVVDPGKAGKIAERNVIAENENQALLKADVIKLAAEFGKELEQLDVYVQLIGTFIRPRKDTQRVKVVKTDEED